MGSRIIRNKDADTERVYKAAEQWVERALLSDDSLFTPGTAIWSSYWLGELRQRLFMTVQTHQAAISSADYRLNWQAARRKFIN